MVNIDEGYSLACHVPEGGNSFSFSDLAFEAGCCIIPTISNRHSPLVLGQM
jgi:hypothetical protein